MDATYSPAARCQTSPLGGQLARLGLRPAACEPLISDASLRRFFRLPVGAGQSVVLMLYPAEAEPTVRRHAAVFRWAWRQGLPVPQLFVELRGALLVEDLGRVGAREAVATNPQAVQEQLLSVLAAFQAYRGPCPWNPPFDQELFFRELQQFLQYAGLGKPPSAPVLKFCRSLAVDLTAHPYRLCHRDFHLDNLLASPHGLKAVDFQDLRWGPDTYDVASLLRERGGSTLLPASLVATAAQVLQWEGNWEDRFVQCAAQRGLKALGTFLKLVRQGRNDYERLIPEVATNTWQAVSTLRGPSTLLAVLEKLSARKGL